MSLIKSFDQHLLDLIWSLWTELGVRGHQRSHQNCLISLEELIILTAVLAEIDPRLRDESLDWCSQYHHFFSISRLKALMKEYDFPVEKAFSTYSATLNAISSAHWPVFHKSSPLSVQLKSKSSLRSLGSPALFNLKTRSLFGTGARADLVAFFLTHENRDFAIADTVDIGYSKRNLAEILEELYLSGFVEKLRLRNQWRYRLLQRELLIKLLSPLPKLAPAWNEMLQAILAIRYCLQKIENAAESTQVVEIRNTLQNLDEKLKKLHVIPPTFEGNISDYLSVFARWMQILIPLKK